MSLRQTAYKDFYEGTIGLKEELSFVETTDATVTTLVTITLEDDSFGYLIVTMLGSQTGVSICGRKLIHWRTTGGGASVLSSTDIVADSKFNLTTATWTVDATGITLRIRVTGEVGTNIAWYAMYDNNFQNVTPP